MLTRIDHVTIAVPRLEQGIDAFTRLGFAVHPGGAQPGRGTEERDRLLRRGLPRARERERRRGAPGEPRSGRLARAGRGTPLHRRAERRPRGRRPGHARARGRRLRRHRRRAPHAGRPRALLADGAPRPGQPACPSSSSSTSRRSTPGGARPRGPASTRTASCGRSAPTSPCRTSPGPPRSTPACSGCPCPTSSGAPSSRPTWRCSQLGPTGLGVAQPAEPGPAADAIARRGPGPFQVLYRTRSMDAAARVMAAHGVPPPVRGVRNTGEQAMLVRPDEACGVYVGFVGPA